MPLLHRNLLVGPVHLPTYQDAGDSGKFKFKLTQRSALSPLLGFEGFLRQKKASRRYFRAETK